MATEAWLILEHIGTAHNQYRHILHIRVVARPTARGVADATYLLIAIGAAVEICKIGSASRASRTGVILLPIITTIATILTNQIIISFFLLLLVEFVHVLQVFGDFAVIRHAFVVVAAYYLQRKL